MHMRLWVLAAAAALLAACGPLQTADIADITHWTDFDDGSAALAAFADDAAVARSAVGAQRYIVSRNGELRGLEAFAARRGDTLHALVAEAGFAVVETDDPAAYRRFADVIVRDAVIEWLPPTTNVAFESHPDDPPFSGSADFFFDLQWGHIPVRATAAWHEGVRGQDVRVAVIDTGFDLTHPDLAPNINLALSETFVPGETLQYMAADPFSHGSHTAGTIGAAENDFGTIGVAPDVELVLVKVLSDVTGSGAFSWVMSGMLHAALVDADIANMSLGADLPQRGFEDSSGEWVSAREVAEIRVAMQRVANFGTWMGTLYVASAGNSAIDFDKSADLLGLPRGIQRIMAVSATAPIGWATHFQPDPDDRFWDERFDHLASYSNYGRSAIDVSAPGGDFIYPTDEACAIAGLLRPCWVFDLVFSTGNGGWYWGAGTSMAAPHASGVAALILSEAGGSGAMTPAQLEQAIYRRADDLGQRGNDAEHGRGGATSGY
jgi:lantibiotic leader peptide-processing serine protease